MRTSRKAKVPATQTVEITDFVPAGAIDFMYMEHPYYLAPASKQGVKAYALLRDALAETKRVGIGTIVIRQREQLVAVEPAGKTLSLTTMRFAHEIRGSEDLDVPELREGYGIKEMDLARKLIDTLAGDWTPEKYRDTYTEVLRQAIQQKVEGKEITVGERPAKTAKVVNLVDALRASLQQKTAPKPAAAARGEAPRELAKAGARNAAAAAKRRRARTGRAS